MTPNAFSKSFYNVQVYIERQTAGPCARLSTRKLFLGYQFMSPEKKWETKNTHTETTLFSTWSYMVSALEKKKKSIENLLFSRRRTKSQWATKSNFQAHAHNKNNDRKYMHSAGSAIFLSLLLSIRFACVVPKEKAEIQWGVWQWMTRSLLDCNCPRFVKENNVDVLCWHENPSGFQRLLSLSKKNI